RGRGADPNGRGGAGVSRRGDPGSDAPARQGLVAARHRAGGPRGEGRLMQTPRSCLILGSGVGGLALGALLARAGVEVTILEAHPELVGGWAHTLHLGPYRFSAGPRYLWNFGPGQIGRRFLEKCALAESVPMVELDRRGFDHIY